MPRPLSHPRQLIPNLPPTMMQAEPVSARFLHLITTDASSCSGSLRCAQENSAHSLLREPGSPQTGEVVGTPAGPQHHVPIADELTEEGKVKAWSSSISTS